MTEMNSYPDEVARKWKRDRDQLLEVAQTTAGNIRSLRASHPCTTFDVWLETVEKAIGAAERAIVPDDVQSLIVSGDGPEGWTTIQARELAALHAQLAEVTAQRDELLAAAKAQHKALDHLLAQLIGALPGFIPSESAAWPAVVQGNAAIARAEGIRS